MTNTAPTQSAKSSANASAYSEALTLAARYHWEGVYALLMRDGFDPKMDYVGLLELWHLDSTPEEDQPALFI
jgi:hypothetical protein